MFPFAVIISSNLEYTWTRTQNVASAFANPLEVHTVRCLHIKIKVLRTSLRAKIIRDTRNQLTLLEVVELQRKEIFGDGCSLIGDFIDIYNARYQEIESRRYIHRGSYRFWDTSNFKNILCGECEGDLESTRYTSQFLWDYRMDPDSFFRLNSYARNHPIFVDSKTGTKNQAPSELQLLVLLKIGDQWFWSIYPNQLSYREK